MKSSIIYLTTPLFPDAETGIPQHIAKLRGEILSVEKDMMGFQARAYSLGNEWKALEPARHLRLPLHKVDYVVDEG